MFVKCLREDFRVRISQSDVKQPVVDAVALAGGGSAFSAVAPGATDDQLEPLSLPLPRAWVGTARWYAAPVLSPH